MQEQAKQAVQAGTSTNLATDSRIKAVNDSRASQVDLCASQLSPSQDEGQVEQDLRGRKYEAEADRPSSVSGAVLISAGKNLDVIVIITAPFEALRFPPGLYGMSPEKGPHPTTSAAPMSTMPVVRLLPSLPTPPSLNGSQLEDTIWPTSFISGGAHLSSEQAASLFDEFFAHYHPSCPIFLRRREPAPVYRAEPLLFWAICGIGASRHAPPGVVYADLMDVVKDMVAGLLSEPWRTLGTVQALVLLCEWQVPATARWGGRGWYYGGLAVQMALQIGLHRPHHAHEFRTLDGGQQHVRAESTDGQERTLAWIFCHIVSHSIACNQGLPPPISDDYVALEASAPGPPPPWLGDVPRQALDALRIARLTARFTAALGCSPLSASGALPAPGAPALFSLFSAELAQLERSVDTGVHGTMMRLHLCRMRLCAFALQTPPGPGTAEQRVLATTDCYVSGMRLAEAACAMPLEEAARLPVSVAFGYSMACLTTDGWAQICLVRLLSTPEGQALDMGAALTQVSAVYRVAAAVGDGDGDELRRNFALLISFCVRHAQHLSADDAFPRAESRMGLPNWLYDCVVRAKHARSVFEANAALAQAGVPPMHDRHDAMDSAVPPLLAPAPAVDYSMFSSSDFDEILASFSRGEWAVPSSEFFPTW
ncbi:hypothetical protein HWV62_16206 [Athelia sp. TMB]|nr:hypothetical protein HWV62_16206 [Athelia sp. TMB]